MNNLLSTFKYRSLSDSSDTNSNSTIEQYNMDTCECSDRLDQLSNKIDKMDVVLKEILNYLNQNHSSIKKLPGIDLFDSFLRETNTVDVNESNNTIHKESTLSETDVQTVHEHS